ncbi:MAG TPA: DUF368 domain-containing protein [Syntrophomonadaceae bacterium]|nr:DUF368 domain-containing protein [Syntrophomonadaceae bacterium]HNX28932.1 DUF368 domain-containing protein [Syntrophomonadaceae bacterium]HPR93920.1 DUF368 domain-containing protein [Syntrophomonadaceae bacterium]
MAKFFKNALSGATEKVIKGAIIGLIIVLPGVSGGTILLMMGLYEELMKDLSRFRLLPWLPFAIGMAGGIFISGWLLAWLFKTYTAIILALLLGCILASVKSILGQDYRPSIKRGISLAIGLILGFILGGVSDFGESNGVSPGAFILIAGGALSTAAMILPGVPGNAVLIIMGIYDDILSALAGLDAKTLIIFAAGCILGVIGLSNALDKIYSRWRDILNWFFVGLVIGSGRMLVPAHLDNPLVFILIAMFAFALVWIWESRSMEPEHESISDKLDG